MIKDQIINAVILALHEDIGSGDITTNSIIPEKLNVTAKLIAKGSGVICGMGVAHLVFKSVDKNVQFTPKVKDGASVRSGTVIAVVKGPARGILTAERTALNFLQRMSGIATLTSRFVKLAGKKLKVLDTRKTSPGLRILDKYAVKCGGGENHRIGLFDAVLIKDNHIKAVGSLKKAVLLAKKKFPKVEVEAGNLKQVQEAIASGASRILLDNMSVADIRKAVKNIRSSGKKIDIEVSGGVNLQNIPAIAVTGADFVSVGALTHSAPALDISLKIDR
jgi:nicotinate-nucleotide pyrophosphorylase (carboxylating)